MIVRSTAAALAALPLLALAQEDGWDWRGETSLRVENYGIRGDATASPYTFRHTHPMLAVSLDAERRDNAFDYSRFYFSGTQSASRYYSTHDGFFPERLNYTRQSGTSSLPYQAQGGDFFGVFSFRTLQTALRGGMLELQPQSDNKDRRHSLVFVSGAAGQSYRQFQFRDNWFNGTSYLFEDRSLGRYSLNLVHNLRQGEAVSATLDRRQTVWSGAAEVPFEFALQRFRFETEWAALAGDHDGTAGAVSGQSRKDRGFYSELAARGIGQVAPLDWRLRLERYGQDYRPAGGAVSADRYSREAFAGWRFGSGLNLRGRLQAFRDGWDSGNLTRTDTGGVTLTGPIFAALLPGWSGNLDGYAQRSSNSITPTDLRTRSLRADASRSFPNRITLRLGVGWLDQDDRVTAGASSTTRDLLATVTHAMEWRGWRGSVSYGGTLREITGSTAAARQFLPLASASVTQGPHSLLASVSHANLNQIDPAQIDIRATSLAFGYRYDLPQDKFAAELSTNYRNPLPGASTEAYRMSLTWTHLFEKPRVAQLGRVPVAAEGVAQGGGGLDLAELAPGRQVQSLENRFESLGLRSAIRPAPNLVAYDFRLLDEIDQRQRVALQTRDGQIERSVLAIDFDDVGSVNTVAQTFERVRQALIRRYGSPASVFNRGDFRPSLVDDVQTDQFIRLTEWRVADGVIRFGIPRRLDRLVRMEVQFARSFPDASQTRWSLEDLR